MLNETALETLRKLPRLIDSEYVFPGRPRGKAGQLGTQPISELRRSFRGVVKAAKIKKRCTFHTLRHTFISHLVMDGVPLPTVMKLARHRSIQMTLRYAHLAPGHERSAVERLSGMFDKQEAGNEEEISGTISGSGEKAGQAIAVNHAKSVQSR